MRNIILASLLLSTPALADQPTPPGQQAWQIMFNREVIAHQSDLGAAVELQDRVQALQKQVADLTKERDALRAKSADAAPPDAAQK